MLEITFTSAFSDTVGLKASFSTTLSLPHVGALKCMYFDNIFKVTYHSNKCTHPH